jgi:hypothetical protein
VNEVRAYPASSSEVATSGESSVNSQASTVASSRGRGPPPAPGPILAPSHGVSSSREMASARSTETTLVEVTSRLRWGDPMAKNAARLP